MVVSLIAMSVALSGTAVAGTTALITGAQIKDKSIGLADISNTAITKLRGRRGPEGPQGPAGADGIQGPPGLNGGFDVSKVQVVQGPEAFIASFNVGSSVAQCPAGSRVLGGGFLGTADPFISFPLAEAWSVSASTTSPAGARIRAFAVCGAP
jgi:hypothetical protein